MHARGQVAFGDGRQQLRELAEVVIADRHHCVEVFQHQAEIVIEALRVATAAEVACGGGTGQLLDLGVDAAEVGLDRVDGGGHRGLLAGVARDVAAQIAHRVLLHHVQHIVQGLHVAADQSIGFLHHQPVLAGEGAGIDAVAQFAAVVATRHLALAADHRVQLLLHAGHGVQQAAGLVMRLRADVAVQLAAGDTLGDGRCLLQRYGDAVADEPAQGQHDQYQHATGDGHDGGEHQCLLLHVVHVDATADHPVPGREQAGVSHLLDLALAAGLGPAVVDEAATGLGCFHLVVVDAHAVVGAEILHVLADQVLAERVHQQAVAGVVDVEIVGIIIGAHHFQRLQGSGLGSVLAELAGTGQAMVVLEDAVAEFDLGLQRGLAGLGQVEVLHAGGDHRERDHAKRDEQRQQVELAPDGEVAEVVLPAMHEIHRAGPGRSGRAAPCRSQRDKR